MTPTEMNVLRRLTEKGEVIYGGTRPGSDMSKLIEAGLVKATAVNISEVLYEMTPAGRKSIEEN
jgi:hypothetical protein